MLSASVMLGTSKLILNGSYSLFKNNFIKDSEDYPLITQISRVISLCEIFKKPLQFQLFSSYLLTWLLPFTLMSYQRLSTLYMSFFRRACHALEFSLPGWFSNSAHFLKVASKNITTILYF